MSTIVIDRSKLDITKRAEIVIGWNVLGVLEKGQSTGTFDIEPGQYQLEIEMGLFCKSNKLTFTIHPGETSYFDIEKNRQDNNYSSSYYVADDWPLVIIELIFLLCTSSKLRVKERTT